MLFRPCTQKSSSTTAFPSFLSSYQAPDTMGDKKRKRLDGKGQRPRKKAAPLSAPLPSVTVLPVEHDGNSGPVLGTWAGFRRLHAG